MSFLSQAIFYFINGFIDFLAGDHLSLDVTTGFNFLLIGISVVMMIIGFIAIFRIKGKAVKYLDIPLIFVTSILNIVFDMYVSDFSDFSLVPGFFGLIPGAFYTVRVIKWIIDVAKKRRKPQKKNAIVVVVYVLATISLFALMFVDFEADKQKPTEEEIQLVDKCYEYTTKYLTSLPTDEATLQDIEAITAEVTEKDIFVRSFDESEYYKNSQGGILRGVTQLKDINRKGAFADIVALRLKTLIALKDYDSYNKFFIDNCGYLLYVDDGYYFDLWANDSYVLSKKDFNVIISGFINILELADNDSDRLFINSDIIDFYNQYDPDNDKIEKYYKLRSDIYNNNDFEDLLETARNNRGYLTEALAVEQSEIGNKTVDRAVSCFEKS